MYLLIPILIFGQQRDNGASENYDIRFQRIINRIFTSCDSYSEDPQQQLYEISETELRNELDLLRYIWWGN
jgi:hypothetical protein